MIKVWNKISKHRKSSRSKMTQNPGNKVIDLGVNSRPVLQPTDGRSKGHNTHALPPSNTFAISFNRHQRTARVSSARIFPSLATGTNLRVHQISSDGTIHSQALISTNQRQIDLQLDVGSGLGFCLAPTNDQEVVGQIAVLGQTNGVDVVCELHVSG